MATVCRNGHPRIPENLRPRKDGYFDCIPCGWVSSKKYKKRIQETIRARGKEYYEKNREQVLARSKIARSSPEWQNKRLQRLYGISLEEYQTLCVLQKEKCAICGAKGELVVDHCHTTGIVRGMLCSFCNTGLGYFRDEPNLLTQAATYLLKKR